MLRRHMPVPTLFFVMGNRPGVSVTKDPQSLTSCFILCQIRRFCQRKAHFRKVKNGCRFAQAEKNISLFVYHLCIYVFILFFFRKQSLWGGLPNSIFAFQVFQVINDHES